MSRDEAAAFREMYKGRIIGALRCGNSKRPWWATVDGRRASPSRRTTSTFTSPILALKCAKRMVDDQIAYLSRLRSTNPEDAVAWSQMDLNEAEMMMRLAKDAQTVEYARNLLARVKRDLTLAETALARTKARAV